MLGGALIVYILPIPPAVQAPPDTTGSAVQYAFDVAGAPLSDALDRFGSQTGIDLIYPTDLGAGKTTWGRIEEAPASDVLSSIHQGTGVVAEKRREESAPSGHGSAAHPQRAHR